MAAPRTVVVDDSDSNIHYQGSGWVQEPPGSYDVFGNFGPTYQHTIHSTSTGGVLTYSFSGTSLNVVGTTNVGGPLPAWDCYVDNVKIEVVKPFTSRENNWQLCKQNAIADGQHELKINVTSSAGTFAFDYLEYTPSPDARLDASVVKVSFTDPAIRFSEGQWQEIGGTSLTNTIGARVEFNFIGKSLSWLGYVPKELGVLPTNGTYSIDGGAPVPYRIGGLPNRSTSIYFQTFFTTPDLPVGPHNIVVTHQGAGGEVPLTLGALYITNSSAPDLPAPTQTAPPKPEQNASVPIGAIVGGVVTALAVICAILAFFLLRRRRRRSPKGALYDLSEPDVYVPPRHAKSITPYSDPYPPVPQTSQATYTRTLTAHSSRPSMSASNFQHSRSSLDLTSSTGHLLPPSSASGSGTSLTLNKQREGGNAAHDTYPPELYLQDGGYRMTAPGHEVEELPPNYTLA